MNLLKNTALWFLLTALFILPWIKIRGNEKSEISVELNFKEEQLTLNSSLIVKARSPNKLLHLLYDFNHLQEVVNGVCEISLVSEKKDSHIVCYSYSGPLWSIKSKFNRTLEADRIIFQLLDVKSTGKLPMPTENSSTGYYKIEHLSNEQYKITYFQQGNISLGILSKLYLQQVKTKTTDYLTKLQKYINSKFEKA